MESRFLAKNGFKLTDAQELEIERLIEELPAPASCRDSSHRESHSSELVREYIDFLKNQTNKACIHCESVLTSAMDQHTTSPRRVFSELGASVAVINDKPDGRNINLNCGSLHLSELVPLVKERDLDLGVAFDGDADRSLFVTSSGKIFDGDFVLFVLAVHFHAPPSN